MAYSFIRLVQSYNDPVWGQQALPRIKSPLIRVWRNRLRKAKFEWVGFPKSKCDIASWKRSYPIVMYEEGLPMNRDFMNPKLP